MPAVTPATSHTRPSPPPPAHATPVTTYTAPPPAVRAILAAHTAGIPLTRQDVPPDLVAALHHHAQILHTALQPVTELHVAAWLKKLGRLVTNPPGAGQAASQCRAIFEVCGDIPTGAWGPEARLAWTRQPPRDGYPVGARWPSPNELRTILLPFANGLRRDAAASRTLLASLPPSLRMQAAPSPHAVKPADAPPVPDRHALSAASPHP
ncbi:hypothetical protein KBX73_03915 [Acetobacter persici]|uniref:hypothetical protein n=1 Tax=Acetobacter persici TaxID=1076596 RepID=UPI0020CEBA31|nr:hypothetical protein [Acetobacter persici]MCP9318935.1 hypothetical protein [Acetobacter persici]